MQQPKRKSEEPSLFDYLKWKEEQKDKNLKQSLKFIIIFIGLIMMVLFIFWIWGLFPKVSEVCQVITTYGG